jgi:hypothetical protein
MRSTVEWVPGNDPGRLVSGWGTHTFAWWRKQAKSSTSEFRRPEASLRVKVFAADGQQGTPLEFWDYEISEAKAAARAWVEGGGISAVVEGRVRVPGEGTITVQIIGEFRSKQDRGLYVWDVREDGMPYGRRGPYSDVDEANRDARRFAETSGRDNIVTLGADPEANGFEILKAFKARSGEVYLASESASAGRRLREYR